MNGSPRTPKVNPACPSLIPADTGTTSYDIPGAGDERVQSPAVMFCVLSSTICASL
jgi:hypothetical protein